MSRIRIRIPGANEIISQEKFLGAKVFYIISNGFKKKPKTVWGKLISLHGRNGIFLAKFKSQVSPVEITSAVYIIPKPSLPL
jgi:ribosomal protein L35AE/L33A